MIDYELSFLSGSYIFKLPGVIPNDVIGDFCAGRHSLALKQLLRKMYGQDHSNAFFADQYHASNVNNIEKMLKDHSDIEHSSWFK